MVGKRKNPSDNWLPSRVYRGRTKFEFHPRSGGNIILCPLDAERSEVWAAYERLTVETDKTGPLTVGQLAKNYFASIDFRRLGPRTQKDRWRYWSTLASVFGSVDASRVLPKHVRKYMDVRGVEAPVQANRERALLSYVFGYAFERSLVRSNPCIGVRKFPEPGRDKYIEDDEYYPFLAASSDVCQVFMEISYLCAARGQDVRAIMLADLSDQGIYIQQIKTKKKQIKLWTPRLREAVDLALKIRGRILARKKILSLFLIVNRFGSPYTDTGLKSIWRSNRSRIAAGKDLTIDWTYHDIKAKGISDFEGDKQIFSGHKSRLQMERYNRKAELVPTLDTPKPEG